MIIVNIESISKQAYASMRKGLDLLFGKNYLEFKYLLGLIIKFVGII